MSIRRALSDLTDEGYLIKTGAKKTGKYGEPENYWRLK